MMIPNPPPQRLRKLIKPSISVSPLITF